MLESTAMTDSFNSLSTLVGQLGAAVEQATISVKGRISEVLGSLTTVQGTNNENVCVDSEGGTADTALPQHGLAEGEPKKGTQVFQPVSTSGSSARPSKHRPQSVQSARALSGKGLCTEPPRPNGYGEITGRHPYGSDQDLSEDDTLDFVSKEKGQAANRHKRRTRGSPQEAGVQSYGNDDCPRETSSDSDEEVRGKIQESRSQSIHSSLYGQVVRDVPRSGQQASQRPHPAQRGDWSSEASDDEAHQWESRQRRYIGEVCAQPLSSAHYRHGEYQYEERRVEEDFEEYYDEGEEEEECDDLYSQGYYDGRKDIVEEDTTENMYSDEASQSPSLSHSPRLLGSERVGVSLNDVPDSVDDGNSQGSRGPEPDAEMDQEGYANEGYNGGAHSESSAIISTEEGSAQCSLSQPPQAGQESASAVSSCGTLAVQMDFCKRTQKVSVLVEKVVDLLPRERTGATAWQIHLVLLPMKRQRFRSSVQRGDELTFDETFRFSGIEDSELARYGVRFRLYAIRSINRERLMGESLFYMSRLIGDNHIVGRLRLEPRSTINPNLSEPSPSDSNSSAHSLSYGGNPEILVGLGYNPTTGRLSVEIIKGSHFRNLTVSWQPDTYVKLTLQDSTGQEISQSKTSLRRGQPNPVYKETFVFQVALFQLSDIILTLSVFSKRSMKRKEIVGSVSLGANSRVEEERTHWDEMKQCKGSQVCRWHQLQEV